MEGHHDHHHHWTGFVLVWIAAHVVCATGDCKVKRRLSRFCGFAGSDFDFKFNKKWLLRH